MTAFARSLCSVFCALALVLAWAPAAWAYRVLPASILVGNLEGVDAVAIKISGRVYPLAPGIRIRDRDNRVLVPVSAPQAGKVAFFFDQFGQVLGVWLLTAEEIPRYADREVEEP